MCSSDLLGALLASHPVLHVAGAVTVAVVCGFAGAVGPRSGFGGVLCLVLFVIFSGGPTGVELAAADALRFAAGAGLADQKAKIFVGDDIGPGHGR